mmetsp:Transcript_111538/g.314950  ORF Transcript_111538/g.314950 Transcript_111538/m.314950 type:complete len:300 (-) Transcript_111538:122-1021(-)
MADADAQGIISKVIGLDEDTAIGVITSILSSRPELAPAVVSFAVPDLTYPPAKTLSERRAWGVVKSFNEEKGFGFIDCYELKEIFGNDVFVHGKQMKGIAVGSEVSFAVALNKDNKPQGYDIVDAVAKAKCGGKGFEKGCKGMGFGEWGKGLDWFKGGDDWWGKGCAWGKGEDWSKSGKDWHMGAPWGKDGKDGKDGKNGGGLKGGKKRPYSMGPGEARGPDVAEELGQFVGHIKSFSEKSGYGFIDCQDLKQQGYTGDVFLHHVQATGHKVGAQVMFVAFKNGKDNLQAKDLMPVVEG